MEATRRSAVGLALASFLGVAFGSRTAGATWPMARHDAKRVGAATGTGNLVTPTPYWRTYLGGAITGSQLLVENVTGNGGQDLLISTSGQVIAKDPTDAILWQTPARGIHQFAGIGDVNGDGVQDVVAYSKDHVIIVSVQTGAIEWIEPDGEMGTIGSVRLGDVSGDGKPDVLVTECGCCGVNSGNSGFYWSFASGFGSAVQLGSLPVATFTCGTATSVTLLQADASPPLETLLANDSQFSLLGADGSLLAQTGTLGARTAESVCTTANIDGSPGDEAVCLLNTSDAPATNERRVTVLHYDYTAQPAALTVLWSSVVAPDAGGDMNWVDPLQDLDGDGLFEVVVSTNDPTNGWRTHIYDALLGTELITPIPGQTIAGTAPMESMTSRLVLTSSGSTVTAWAFARSPSPTIAAHWSESNVTVLTFPNQAQASVQGISAQALATDLNGDGLADAVMSSQTSSTVTSLLGFSGAGGNATQIASLGLPSNIDLLTGWVVPAITLKTPQVAIARSDGILNVLDGHLQPTSAGPSPVEVRVGGYYASGAWEDLYSAPRVVALGTGPAQSVVVNDSRQALLRLDAATASLAIPPTLTWQVTHTFGPTVVSNLNGNNPAMACLAFTEPVTNPPQYRARVVNADGSLGWDEVLTGVPLNDLAPGNFNGDGVPDFALQLGSASNADLSTMAISGADGSVLWRTQPVFPGGGGTSSAGVSVGQWSLSGVDDVYYQGTGTFVLSGADGSQLASGGPPNAYDVPMLYDTSGSGQDEVILNAGFAPVSLYSHDLQTALWTSPDSDHPYPYGALAQCPGTPPTLWLVEGSWQNPARLKLTPMNGSSLGTFTTIVLAGGQLFPNEAAATATGAFLGQLTSANVHSNLTGANRPSAVVGSADGWLYGVNPCAGTLDFAVQFGASVGEAVFGDTDGDGKDEVLVSVANGYLYDLKGFSIDAPAYVWDTDPPTVTNHEVSSITTTNRLSATWASVSGATSYAVQVVTAAGGQLVSMPTWQNVGNVTAISLSGLPLHDDTTYQFAVRAIGPNGPSVDAISPGVTVHFPGDAGADSGADASVDSGSMEGGTREAGAEAGLDAGPAGGGEPGGGGCGCRTVDSRGSEGWLTILAALPFVLVARQRRRGR